MQSGVDCGRPKVDSIGSGLFAPRRLRALHTADAGRHVGRRFCIVGASGTGISRHTVVLISRTGCQRLGIAVVGGHALRHTAAINVHQGGSLREVDELLRQAPQLFGGSSQGVGHAPVCCEPGACGCPLRRRHNSQPMTARMTSPPPAMRTYQPVLNPPRRMTGSP